MGIVQIKKANIGEQVYTQIKNQILNREWKPGEKIPSENQLIELLGVSRGTIRQAVQRLAGEGLISTRQGEGSFVQPGGLDTYFQTSVPLFTIGTEEMAQIFEFRRMLEVGISELAARKITDADLERLEENYQLMQQQVGSAQLFVHTDLEFHKLICGCTRNTLATQIFNSYEELLEPSIQYMVHAVGVDDGVKYHGLILDALRTRDPQRTRALMEEHLDNNMKRFLTAYRKEGGTGAAGIQYLCELREVEEK